MKLYSYFLLLKNFIHKNLLVIYNSKIVIIQFFIYTNIKINKLNIKKHKILYKTL